jgi:hypothetical protein
LLPDGEDRPAARCAHRARLTQSRIGATPAPGGSSADRTQTDHSRHRSVSGKSPDGTVEHSRNYLCRHEDENGNRTHRADGRHRIDGRIVPLRTTHVRQWRVDGLVADCAATGPRVNGARSAITRREQSR